MPQNGQSADRMDKVSKAIDEQMGNASTLGKRSCMERGIATAKHDREADQKSKQMPPRLRMRQTLPTGQRGKVKMLKNVMGGEVVHSSISFIYR